MTINSISGGITMRPFNRINVTHSVLTGMVLMLAMFAALSVKAETEYDNRMPSLAPMLENVTPAVVNIAVTRSERVPDVMRFFDERDLRRFFFDTPPQSEEREPPTRRSRGAGSGVIIDAEKGYIVTNHHVVGNADSVTVGLQDGRQFEAELIGTDARTDLALLRIDADRLQDVVFADITRLRVGDYVVAIGNPFGIGQTVTSGIVSALGRAGINQENYEDFIQTDAAINVGNSGGALVDLNGRLVGINTAIISGSGTNAGVGFAVPVDMVAVVVEHLERDGVVQRGQLGVMIRDYTPALEESLALGAERGALVTQVVPGTAAEEAGIQVSDLVVSINGRAVNNGRDLRNVIGLTRLDETISLELYRDGELLILDAVIRGSGEQVAVASDDQPVNGRRPDDTRFHGARLQDTGAGTRDGVEVNEVAQQSRAAAGGLRPGDVIIQVNRRGVSNLREFNEVVSQVSGVVALTVVRDDQQLLVVLP